MIWWGFFRLGPGRREITPSHYFMESTSSTARDTNYGRDEEASVHLLPVVTFHSVDFSGNSLFMPDSSGAFIKASLEMHALIVGIVTQGC